MKAAIRRILIFLAASGTQNKIPHRSIGPVVRNIDDNRVTRPAIRAVGEGISEAPIARIEQFLAAIIASGQIRKNVNGFPGVVVAGKNFKARGACRGEPRGFAYRYHGSSRPLLLQSRFEAAQLFGGTFNFNHQACGRIQHPSRQRQFRGQPVNEWPESDSLNGSPQGNTQTLRRGFCRQGLCRQSHGESNRCPDSTACGSLRTIGSASV